MAERTVGLDQMRRRWQDDRRGVVGFIDHVVLDHDCRSEFARLLVVSIRTLQEWEQGRRVPSGPAMGLLAIKQMNARDVRPRDAAGIADSILESNVVSERPRTVVGSNPISEVGDGTLPGRN
jgi:hypothetical protein